MSTQSRGSADAPGVTVQVREEAIAKTIAALHVSGVIQHHYLVQQGDNVAEVQFNRPSLSLVSSADGDERPTARVALRALVSLRGSRPTDLRVVGAADLSVAAAIEFPRKAGLLSPAPHLVIEFHDLEPTDIEIHASDADARTETMGALAQLFKERGGGAFAAPLLGGGSAEAPETMAITALTDVRGLAIGRARVDKALPPDESMLRDDWVVAVPNEVLLGAVRSMLAERLRPRGYELWRLHGTFAPAGLTLTGSAGEGSAGEQNAGSFCARVILGVDADGRPTARVATGATWRAQGAEDALQAIEESVRDALTAMLDFTAPGANGESTLGSQLQELFSLGFTVDTSLRPRLTSVEAGRDGVIAHGALSFEGADASTPFAAMAAFSVPDEPGRYVLNAGRSWAPGATIVSYRFDFGDGDVEELSGDDARFVADHTYAPGRYRATVTVTDDRGRSASASALVAAGRLTIHHATLKRASEDEPQASDGGPVTSTVYVLEGDAPVQGASVTVGEAGSRSTTDREGAVRIALQRSDTGAEDSFERALEVTAEAPGFEPAVARLNLHASRDRALAVGAVEYLRDLRDRIDRLRAAVDELPSQPALPGLDAAPELEALADLDAGLSLVDGVTSLALRGSDLVALAGDPAVSLDRSVSLLSDRVSELERDLLPSVR